MGYNDHNINNFPGRKKVENPDKVDIKQEIFNQHAEKYLGRLFRPTGERMLLGYLEAEIIFSLLFFLHFLRTLYIFTNFTFYSFMEKQTISNGLKIRKIHTLFQFCNPGKLKRIKFTPAFFLALVQAKSPISHLNGLIEMTV